MAPSISPSKITEPEPTVDHKRPDSSAPIMSDRPHEGMPEGSVPTENFSSPSSSEGKRVIIPQAPSCSFDSLEALPSALADSSLPPLACPVSGCLLAFKGEMPHRYLKRHLKHPGLYGRTGHEKEVWLNLHKMEHERLLAALGSTPPTTLALKKYWKQTRLTMWI